MAADPIKVFVSYRHHDFEPRRGLKNSRAGEIYGWICDELNIGLAGSGFEIVRDVRFMDEGESVNAEIEAALQEADCALVLISDSYLISEYCRGEYLRLIEMGKPIHVLQLEDVSSYSGQHADIDTILDHQSQHKYTAFWVQDDDEDPRPLGAPLPSLNQEDAAAVDTKVREAAKGLKKRAGKIRIERMMKAAVATTPTASEAARGAGHIKVFFADPTQGQASSLTDRLINRIAEDKYDVVRADLSGDPATLDTRLAEQMADCEFYVQLIGNFVGRPPVDGGRAHILFQHDVARTAAIENDLQIICWRDSTIPIEDLGPDFEDAMQEMRPHKMTFDGFQTFVAKSLAEAATHADIEAERGEIDMPWVVLDGDDSDIELLVKLRDFLSAENANVQIISNKKGDDLMQALADAPKKNDGAIVIYGPEQSSQTRAEIHFEILTKNIMNTSNRNLSRPAVGNSASKFALHPSGPHWDILHLYDGFDETQVRDYLKTVRENMGA